MDKRSSAFTLIELLVVTAVIAVLAGIALPVLNSAAESGRMAKCTGNLRQIGTALHEFANDNSGVFPQAGATFPYQPPSQRSGAIGWSEQLEPYAGVDRSIYICPSSAHVISDNAQYGYFMGCHAAFFANGNQFAAIRSTLLQAPTMYILAGDISASGMFQANDSDKDDYTQDPAFATSPTPFHRGRSNLLFADGHAGAYTAFDPGAMTTHYDLKSDGTGYNYSDQ